MSGNHKARHGVLHLAQGIWCPPIAQVLCFEEGLQVDPFCWDLKAGLEKASQGVFEDLLTGACTQSAELELVMATAARLRKQRAMHAEDRHSDSAGRKRFQLARCYCLQKEQTQCLQDV